MKKKKRVVLFLVFFLVDVLLIGGFLFFRYQANLNLLRKEINTLSSLDVTKDRYNLPLKTHGKCRIVEKAIKEYLDSYALGIQRLSTMVSEEELHSLLSYGNYEEDGPLFEHSTAYLNDFQDRYMKQIDTLLSNLEEESIKNYINQYTDDSYSRRLYQQYMFEDSMLDDILHTKELLINTKNSMNIFYQTHIEIFDFLKTYADSWNLHDGEIEFANNDLYSLYQSYLNKLNK